MRLFARLRRFARAEKGLAALEFALIAPMMIFLLFGSVEIIDALDANKRVQNVASSLADVVARDTEVSNSELAGLWAAANVLMFPDDASAMDVRLTSINIISASNARVVWSEGNGFPPLPANSTVALPSAMMTPGSSVIMAETSYAYAPPLGFLFGDDVVMRHTAYRRSRIVDPIPRVA